MLVSHRKQFIYTKTTKTASTSVEAYFERHCQPPEDRRVRPKVLCQQQVSDFGIVGYRGARRWDKKWYDHMPAARIRRQLDEEVWDGYFKFCVIRNPYEKLVSAFNYFEWLANRARGVKKLSLMWNLGVRPHSHADDLIRFRRWLAWTRGYNDRRIYTIGDQICMDYVIRYESLLEGVEEVCRRVNVPFQPERLPKLVAKSRSKKHAVADYYDAKSIEIVRRRFRFELETFDYEFPADC